MRSDVALTGVQAGPDLDPHRADAINDGLGCDPEREAQDAWLADFLISSPTVDLAGDELTLRSGTVTVTLLDQEVSDPDRPLVGTTWRIDTVIAGSTAASVPAKNDVVLRFPDNVSFTAVASDCTSISGTMSLGNSTITFGRFSVDSVACPTPWAQAIELMRAGRTTYTIDGSPHHYGRRSRHLSGQPTLGGMR